MVSMTASSEFAAKSSQSEVRNAASITPSSSSGSTDGSSSRQPHVEMLGYVADVHVVSLGRP